MAKLQDAVNALVPSGTVQVVLTRTLRNNWYGSVQVWHHDTCTEVLATGLQPDIDSVLSELEKTNGPR